MPLIVLSEIEYNPLVHHALTYLRAAFTLPPAFINACAVASLPLLYQAMKVLEPSLEGKEVLTPTGTFYHGKVITNKIVLVSMERAGDLFKEQMYPLLRNTPGLDVVCGSIGIARDEATGQSEVFYDGVKPVKDAYWFILDPMVATGGSAENGIELLLDKGAQQKRISYLSLISAPEGNRRLTKLFPDVNFFTSFEDEKLNDVFYIIPGLGDAGDRYSNTVVSAPLN